MMSKEQRLIEEFRIREELYENDMLDEYFYYEDAIIDKLVSSINYVKLG